MSLTTIENGDLADAEVLMGNFIYLNGRITDTNTVMSAMETSFVSNMNTIVEESLSIYQDIIVPESTSGEIELESNKIYRITPTDDVQLILPTITTADNLKFHQIYVQLFLDTLYAYKYNSEHIIYTKSRNIKANTVLYNSDGSVYAGEDFTIESVNNAYVIKYDNSATTYSSGDNIEVFYDVDLGTDWGFNGITPEITQTGRYNVFYEYDGDNWVCGISKRSEGV